MRYSTTLLQESDHVQLQTDNTLFIPGPDGKPEMVHPYRLGPLPPAMNRRPTISMSQPMLNGNPQALKRMPPPTMMVQPRVPSNGMVPRPPSVVLGMQAAAPHPLVPSQINGVHSSPPNGNSQEVASADKKALGPSQQPSPDNSRATPVQINGHAQIPSPRLNQNQQQHQAPAIPNGHYPAVANGFPQPQINGASYLQPPNGQSAAYSSMTMQQIQELKLAYGNGQQLQPPLHAAVPPFNSVMYSQPAQQHYNNVGPQMKLVLPPQRAQWQALTQQMQQNTQLAAGTPMRTPSANGKRPSRPTSASDAQAQMASYLQHGPPNLPLGIHPNAHLSPPRATPPMIQSPRLPQSAGGGQ